MITLQRLGGGGTFEVSVAMWDRALRKAQLDQQEARSCAADPEWMVVACGISQQWAISHSKMTPEEIAKASLQYMELRAHTMQNGRPVDRLARKEWVEMGGESPDVGRADFGGSREGREAMSRMLVLGRDGLGSSDESEYEGWLNWVCAHIDGACGFEVDVDRSSPRDVQDDKVLGCTYDELAVVKEAIQTMWDDYCSEGAP